MKTLKLIAVLPLVILFASCSRSAGGYKHILLLSVQDVSGNDLVEGIAEQYNDPGIWSAEIDPDLFTLDIVFPNLCMDVYYQHHHNTTSIAPAEFYPELKMKELDGRNYLLFETLSRIGDDCDNSSRIITFKLTCPYVFGDEKVHEIVTHWEKNECHKVVFDSTVIDVVGVIYNIYPGANPVEPHSLASATVILD